jgi:hypothetical protein
MEPQNNKVAKGFISEEEAALILDWIDGISPVHIDPNLHLATLSKSVNGKALMFDISQTEKTAYITEFQKVSKIIKDGVPDFISSIISRISEFAGIPKDDVFLQAVDMRKGGKISPHYDAAIEGCINYKCNISVLSEGYDIFVGDEALSISQRDLYCFEASLYKHWTNEFSRRRVFLSIGFIVPYSALGRSEEDPRVRLSKRIQKYFQQFNI